MDQTPVSHIAGRFFIVWATREAPKTKQNKSLKEGEKDPMNKGRQFDQDCID